MNKQESTFLKTVTVREINTGTIQFNSQEEYEEWLRDQKDGNHQWEIQWCECAQEFFHENGAILDFGEE
jgi:hypothetical protein